MDIGTALLLMVIWMLPIASMFSKTVTNFGFWLNLFIAAGFTIYLAQL